MIIIIIIIILYKGLTQIPADIPKTSYEVVLYKNSIKFVDGKLCDSASDAACRTLNVSHYNFRSSVISFGVNTNY